jgi:hypothetical protein
MGSAVFVLSENFRSFFLGLTFVLFSCMENFILSEKNDANTSRRFSEMGSQVRLGILFRPRCCVEFRIFFSERRQDIPSRSGVCLRRKHFSAGGVFPDSFIGENSVRNPESFSETRFGKADMNPAPGSDT